jgi:two-component system OmpR family response regulator
MSTHTDHILVVDDDGDIRQLVGDYLRRNGLRVSQAADGREMRALLETSDVDLIVLDVMMPGEDGLSLCRNLRAGKHRAVPVVMLTARDDETDRIIGLEMGADDYVVKPFSSRELLARITAVIRRAHAAAEPAGERGRTVDPLWQLAAGYQCAAPAG